MNWYVIAGWLCSCVMAASFIALCRNEWVYRQRSRLNDRSYQRRVALLKLGISLDRIDQIEPWYTEVYLSYGEMMARFWCWDIEKLQRKAA